VKRAAALVEDSAATLALLAMVSLPLLEVVFRRLFERGIPGSGPIVQHLTLWVGFLGAAIAAREGKLLSLASGTLIPEGRFRRAAEVFAAAIAAGVSTILASGAVDLVTVERAGGASIGAGIPTWWTQLVLPLGFALIAVRQVWRVRSGVGRAIALAFRG